MNPQQPGGQPPPPYHDPNLPQADPNTPLPQAWAPPPAGTAAPEQQYGPTAIHPGAHQQYDFILNPEKAPKKPLIVAGGNSLVSRLAIFGGLLVILIVLGAVVASMLGGKGGDIVALTTVAQDQAELVRVAGLANSQTTSQATQNVAVTVGLSVSSDNKQLLGYLATNHVKIPPKVLSLKRDSRTDTQLKTAADASNFDSAFVQAIQTQLTAYQRDLKVAYSSEKGPKGRALLTNEYNAAGLLLKQTQQQ